MGVEGTWNASGHCPPLSLLSVLFDCSSASSTWEGRCHTQCPSLTFHSFSPQRKPTSPPRASLRRAWQGCWQAGCGPAPTSKAITKAHRSGWREHVDVPTTTWAPGEETSARRSRDAALVRREGCWIDTMVNNLSPFSWVQDTDNQIPLHQDYRVSTVWSAGVPKENTGAFRKRGRLLDSEEMAIIMYLISNYDVSHWKVGPWVPALS